MADSQVSSNVQKNILHLVRNMRDQLGLALLDLENGLDPEALYNRFETVEEFSQSARQVLQTCVHGRNVTKEAG